MARKFQPTWGATAATALMLAVLLGLGIWQVQRLEWKKQLIETVSIRMTQAAVPLPETADNPDDWEYRPVTMTGQYLHCHEFLIKPRTMDGKVGYHLVTPFRRLSGGHVFVDRGFVSDDTLAGISRPQGITQVSGIAVVPQKNNYTPANVPEKDDWYWADIPAMTQAAGITSAAPLMVQAQVNPSGAYPVPQKVAANIRNNHAQYALFWFSMAAVLLVIYFIRYWKEEKNNDAV